MKCLISIVNSEVIPVMITSGVTIIGFIITYISMKKQFLNSVNLALHNIKKELYVKTYKLLLKLLECEKIVFESAYKKQLEENWAEICLIANKNVREVTNDLYQYIQKIWVDYDNFYKENDWEKCEIDEYGKKNFTFTDEDIENFQLLENEYKEENKPEKDILESKIEKILSAMRKDLKTDK